MLEPTTNNLSGARPASGSKSYTSVQIIESEVNRLINLHFKATLGSIQDITKLVMACIYKESTFRDWANSGLHSQSHVNKVAAYSAIAAKLSNSQTSNQEKINIRNSVAGFGLMQATGWYLIKGAGPGGKNELSRMRSDLAGPLLVDPGVDINTKLGPGKIENQLLVGLIILEEKLRIAPYLVSNPPTAKKPYTNKLSAMFGGFLGSGQDKNGTTPYAYAASILQGSAYKVANGGGGRSGTTMPTSNTGTTKSGPVTTVASGNNKGPTGCSCS